MSFSAVSYNRLKFSPCVSWDQDAITYRGLSEHDGKLLDMFVDTNDTIYLVYRGSQQIIVWSERNNISLSISSTNLQGSFSLFVTISGDIYVNNDKSIYRVNKPTANKSTASNAIVMNVSSPCIDIFIDFTNTLYCSMNLRHKVVKLLLEYEFNIGEVPAAGNGTNESTSYSLNNPTGIFVDVKLNLYVADSGNNRIQLFRHGNTNGTTVAGNRALGKQGLDFPTGVVLDADGDLFIADRGNQRIIRSEKNGFRCVIGCLEDYGSNFHPYSHHNHRPDPPLHRPQALWFDSYSDMFVLDHDNHRVQEFHLSTNSCGMFNSIEFDYECYLASFTKFI